MTKIVDPDLLVVGTELTLDTTAKTITLNVAGNLVAKDGVTLQALYSKLILLWESSTYNKFPFPLYTIDAKSGQFIFGFDGGTYNGWKPANDATRTYLRDGGWSEYSSGGVLNRQYVGIVSLGDVNTGAQLYYQRLSSDAPANFTFTDEVNEGIQVYGDASNGSFDKRTFFKAFDREAGRKYKDSVLADTGQTATGAYTVNMLLSDEADLDITHSDAYVAASVAISTATWTTGVATINTSAVHGLTTGDIAVITGATPSTYNVRGAVTVTDTDTFTIAISSDPGTYTSGGTVQTIYSLIDVKYFSSAFSKDIDSTTDRNFGIVIDAGSHSGVDGVMTLGGSTLTSAAGNIVGANFTGGTLKVWEGTNAGTYTISGTPSGTVVTITGTFAAAESASSFTIYPAVALGATLQQIYTKVQYLLRQNSDIDSTGGSVTGKTASLLLNFVGSELKCGFYLPTNPNGGGSGVVVEGIRDADLNSITFYDNTAATRVYPYASAGTLNFNSFLTSGGTGYYRMYITDSVTGADDYGTATAITLEDKDGIPITGTITAGTISFSVSYTNNTQGGRVSGDIGVTVVAGNKGVAKPVVSTGVINQSKAISIALSAEQDRAFSNPA